MVTGINLKGGQRMNRLKGKLALITGASSGIGKAIAVKYAEQGVNLIITSRREEKLAEIKQEIEGKYGVEVNILVQDVSDPENVRAGISKLPENLKKIDILVNNAGLALGMTKIHESEASSFDSVIDTNVKGLLYVSRVVIPLMLENNIAGHIVNIGSTAGNAAYAGGGVYCASKSAVKTLSDGIRIDLIDTPLRVTNIQPGMVETNFSVIRLGDKEKAENVYKGIEPLTAGDVADTVIYATNLPQNVQISEITLMPNHQATGVNIFKENK